ncbi:MAG: NAD-dependent epimerase/dehydratase family protein [Patescibacteria group bacterium]|nr:NAD-dependent epimerase/dehydratase family protein [Patescibacteria group bacterium]
MKNFWDGKKVLVTGGSGFIGSHLSERLISYGSHVTIFDRITSKKLQNIHSIKEKVEIIDGDCTILSNLIRIIDGHDIVMNLAAHVGGIEYNRFHHGSIMQRNLSIATTVLEAARIVGVDRFLVVSSACVYPHDAKIPTPDIEGLRDHPEETNAGYGWAKRMAELLGMYYAEEFRMKVAIVRPYNAYGPRDYFSSDRSHVIPSLIRRVKLRENPLCVWGSGKQSRSFLYVEDLVEGMMLATEKYSVADPVNLGSDEEVTIRDLVYKIISICKENINVFFDTSKPDGSPRRKSDNTKSKQALGFSPKISLDEGLRRTIAWYESGMKQIS